MPPPNRLLDAAQEIQRFCRDRGWRFCFIGGIAVQHWGEARLTRDADVLLAGPGPLVVFKAFADRPQDWLDIEGIIVKSGRTIDWTEVRTELGALLELKDDRSALDRLDELLSRHPPR